jgi:hypothetical protein
MMIYQFIQDKLCLIIKLSMIGKENLRKDQCVKIIVKINALCENIEVVYLNAVIES